MFKIVLYLHSCIILLVTTNPLQGLPLYPVVYHQEDYRHELPILVQPHDFTSYPQLFMNQNQLTPYLHTLDSYNDYLQRTYLQNDEQNQRNWAAEQNRFVTDPLDVFKQNSANNYHVLPGENDQPNNNIHCNKRKGKCKTRDNKRVTAKTHNGQQKTNCKCRKRKHTKYTPEKRCGDQSKCLRRSINEYHSNQSNSKDVNVCRQKRPRNKPQKSCTPQAIDHSVDIKKHTSDKNSHLRDTTNQNMITKNTNKLESGLNCKNIEAQTPDIRKTVKNNKNKSNNCRNLSKKDDSYNCRQIEELEEYFNINEDCVYLDNRCTRNDDSFKRYQKKYNSPSDFSYNNNMTPYMMFNQQLYDTNVNFPTNFDYLYSMQNFLNPNTNVSQKRPKNRRTNRRKKPKKCNKKNCDKIKKDFQQADGGEKIVQNISTNFFGVARSEPVSVVSTTIEESQIEKSVNEFPHHIKEDIKNTMKNFTDSKENVPDNYFDEIIDDYYPEFHSDNFYTSKEGYDWNHFRDKHYYSSGDMGELDRERRKYDSTNDVTVKDNDNAIKHSVELKPTGNIKIENEDTEILKIEIYNKEDNSNIKLKKSSEEIHFRTPPALDFPDFKTEMINKDKSVPLAEIYYQPNKITDNRHKNNKMSAYSRVKNVHSNENNNKNKIVDQNYVETVLGHSKVAKYGAPPNKDEIKSGVINYPGYSDGEDKMSKSSDGKAYVVIAKSLPYPI